MNKLVEMMSGLGHTPEVVNYGTVMMEEASRLHAVKSRDDMRKLPVEDQRKLQVYAASRISEIQKEFVVIDTHLFIATREGFWPGMPMDVLQALKPTHLILVSATIEEIKKRRESDATRHRERTAADALGAEIEAAKAFLYASSVISGAAALIVNNATDHVEAAAKQIIAALVSV